MPLYTIATLNEWFRSDIPLHAAKLLQYFSKRSELVLAMLDQSEFVTKTACALDILCFKCLQEGLTIVAENLLEYLEWTFSRLGLFSSQVRELLQRMEWAECLKDLLHTAQYMSSSGFRVPRF